MFLSSDILPVSFPSPYYYLLPETLVVIPCLAQQVDLNGSLHTLNATFFRNSSTINVYYPPAFHFVSVDQEENVVGLGVSAAAQDNHTLYHCQVGGLLSVASRVFVGGKIMQSVQHGERNYDHCKLRLCWVCDGLPHKQKLYRRLGRVEGSMTAACQPHVYRSNRVFLTDMWQYNKNGWHYKAT